MLVTHLGHACVLVDIADTRVLVDPGNLSSAWHDVDRVDAVVITHQHPDHLDPEPLRELLRRQGDVLVLAESEAGTLAADAGVGSTPFVEAVSIGPVTVTPVGEQHALIHEDIPRIGNRGVRLEAEGEPVFYHPGDALDADPGEVDVLAVPLNAPWQRSRDMIGFLRRIAAPVAFPIHDGLLRPAGRGIYLTQARDLSPEETDVRDLAGGEPVPFGT